MAKHFSGEVVLAAATAQNLAALMAALGYTGRALAKNLLIKTGAQVVYLGADNQVSASNGFTVAATTILPIPGNEIDLAGIWLFCTAGDTIEIFAQSI